MKISRGRPTFMKSLKKYPLVSVLLSWSGHLFQCTLQSKYTKVLSSHTSIIAVLYGKAWPNSLVRNFKNFKNSATRVVTKSSYDTSSRYFRLVGTIYRLEWLNKKLIECTSTLIISPQLIFVICLPPNYYFRNAKKKLMLPKPLNDYLKRSFIYSGAFLWNNLPEEIRTSNSLGLFKRSSHRWYSDQYFHTANMYNSFWEFVINSLC